MVLVGLTSTPCVGYWRGLLASDMISASAAVYVLNGENTTNLTVIYSCHFLECRNTVKMVHHLLRKLWYSSFLYCFAFCRSESWKDACSWVADTWRNSSWVNGKRMPGLSPSQTHPLLERLLVKSKKHILKCSKIQPHVTSFIQCTYKTKKSKVGEMPWFVNYNDTFPCFNFKYWGI